jgi:hypothetical protein
MRSRVIALSLWIGFTYISFAAAKPLRKADEGLDRPYFISLLPKANLKLTDSLGSGREGNNLADLPKGEQLFAKKPFKIENGLIHLSGELTKDKPAKVEGIKVERRLKKLHVLHAACWGGSDDPDDKNAGMLIGQYRVHYADKSTATIRIEYGKDVRDWFDFDNGKAVTRGALGWQGKNDYVRADDMKIRLYVSSWDNPHPSKLVTSLDYHSANTLCAPFCVAITAE